MNILENSSKRIFTTGYIALLIGGALVGFAAIPHATHAASSPIGVAIPLYTYPTDGSWAAVIQAKQSYPNVPFIAVVNPDSGPGTFQDSNYVQGIKDLQAAGIKVLGYVPTGYAANSISSEESQVSAYNSWYGVNGIFFDEMSNSGTTAPYYSSLNSYVHSLIPASITMGNPGTSVPNALIGTMDILCVYESSGYPSIGFLTYPGYAPNNFSNMPYGVSLSTSFLSSLSGVSSWTYVTDAGGSNPYGVLPSYLTSEVAELSIIDGIIGTTSSSSTTTSTSTSPSGTSLLTIDAQDTTGAALTGYFVALSLNGAVTSSGYSPTSFTVTNGLTYAVESDGYGGCNFDYWLDTGSANSQRNIAISTNTVLTAVLNCGTGTPTTASVTVTSADLSGNIINGMWTVWSQNGAQLATGFTQATFNGNVGGSYTASVANYGNTIFCYWEDGNLNPSATIALSGNLALEALYSTSGSCPTTTTATTSTSSTVTTPSTTTTTKTTAPSSTTTSTTAKFSVTIRSATTGGAFSGMYTVISLAGATLVTGYTPLAFAGASGSSYTISVANFGSYVFSHWSTGGTNPTITIHPTQATTLTAYYSTISCPPTHKHC